MEPAEWTARLETGHEALDEQHLEPFRLHAEAVEAAPPAGAPDLQTIRPMASGSVETQPALVRPASPDPARRVSELEAILAISVRINAGFTTEQVLNHVYEGFRHLLPYDRLGCAVIDARSGWVRSLWVRSGAKGLALTAGYSAPLAGSGLADIIATGRPRILNDLEEHLRRHPGSESTRRIVADGVRSSLTCPLIANAKPIGFLFFSSCRPATYTAAHTAAYQEIAALISLVLERSLAYDELRQTKKRLEAANGVLARAAFFDALTGAPGRRYFDLLLQREWARAARYGEPLSVIMLDVDHFKGYNDTYGHPAGDECLRRVAESLLGGAQRAADVVARIGGEEFAAVLPRTPPAEALAVAERLRQGVEALDIRHEASRVAPHVTVSLGVTGGVPQRDGNAREFLRFADAALYRAKQGGRNRAVIEAFSPVEP